MGGRGSSSGKKRNSGGGGATSALKTSQPKAITGINPGEVVEGRFDANDPQALEKLREMASRGEIPERITGSRANQARIYEEIDKLYAEPVGVLGDYTVKKQSWGDVEVEYQNFAKVPMTVRVPNGQRASESEINGAIKARVYANRPDTEGLYMWRGGRGGYWADKGGQAAWEGKIFSSQERARITKEWRSGIERDFGTPITKKGEGILQDLWFKAGSGWTLDYNMSDKGKGYTDRVRAEIAERHRTQGLE